MRRKLWVGIAFAAGGCGPGTDRPAVTLPSVEYFGAGSRLMPTVASAEGGADYLLGWYDLELQTPCKFAPGADGALRCLPLSQGLVRFADPGCRAAFAGPALVSCAGSLSEREPAQFFASGNACVTEVYRAASALAPPDTARPGYFFASDGCRQDEESSVGPQSLPLERVAPSEFVAAQLGPGDSERSPGMKAWMLRADDGAWEIRGFFDAQRGVPCSLPEDVVGSDQCLPVPHQRLSPDSSCTKSGVRPASCAAAPAVLYVVADGPGECAPPRLEVYDVQGLERTECVSSPTSGAVESRQVYLPGQALGGEELPTLEHLYTGSGRIRLPFLGHAGVPYFPDPSAARPFAISAFAAGFFDSRFDEPCWPEPFGPDRFLCLSDAWSAAEPLIALNGYASCLSEPLEVRLKRERAAAFCAVPLPALRGFWSGAAATAERGCPGVADGALELRSPRAFAGDVVYSQVVPVDPERPVDCYRAALDADLDYFLPGAPLDPELVAQIQVRTLGRPPAAGSQEY